MANNTERPSGEGQTVQHNADVGDNKIEKTTARLKQKLAFYISIIQTLESQNVFSEINQEISGIITRQLNAIDIKINQLAQQIYFNFVARDELMTTIETALLQVHAMIVELLTNQSWQSGSRQASLIEQRGLMQGYIDLFRNGYQRFIPESGPIYDQLKKAIIHLFGFPLTICVLKNIDVIHQITDKNGQPNFKDADKELIPYREICAKYPVKGALEKFIGYHPYIIFDKIAEFANVAVNIKNLFVGSFALVLDMKDYHGGVLFAAGGIGKDLNFPQWGKIGAAPTEKQIVSLALHFSVPELANNFVSARMETSHYQLKELQTGDSVQHDSIKRKEKYQALKAIAAQLETGMRNLAGAIISTPEQELFYGLQKALDTAIIQLEQINNQGEFFSLIKMRGSGCLQKVDQDYWDVAAVLRSLVKWIAWIGGQVKLKKNADALISQEEAVYAQFQNQQYEKLPGSGTHETLICHSGMACFDTILQYLRRNKDLKILFSTDIYFEICGQLETPNLTGDSFSNFADFVKLVAGINLDQDIAVFVDRIANLARTMKGCNIQSFLDFFQSMPTKRQIFFIIDNSVLGPNFQLRNILGDNILPANIHIIVFKSLQKLDQYGLDLVTGGSLTVFSQDSRRLLEQLRETRDNLGHQPLFDNIGQLAASKVPQMEKRTERIMQNTNKIHQKLIDLKQQYPQITKEVVYADPIEYPEGASLLYWQINQDRSADDLYNDIPDQPNPLYRILDPTRRIYYIIKLLLEECRKNGLFILERTSYGFQDLTIGLYDKRAIRICPPGEWSDAQVNIFNACLENVCRKIFGPVTQNDYFRLATDPYQFINSAALDEIRFYQAFKMPHTARLKNIYTALSTMKECFYMTISPVLTNLINFTYLRHQDKNLCLALLNAYMQMLEDNFRMFQKIPLKLDALDIQRTYYLKIEPKGEDKAFYPIWQSFRELLCDAKEKCTNFFEEDLNKRVLEILYFMKASLPLRIEAIMLQLKQKALLVKLNEMMEPAAREVLLIKMQVLRTQLKKISPEWAKLYAEFAGQLYDEQREIDNVERDIYVINQPYRQMDGKIISASMERRRT